MVHSPDVFVFQVGFLKLKCFGKSLLLMKVVCLSNRNGLCKGNGFVGKGSTLRGRAIKRRGSLKTEEGVDGTGMEGLRMV